MELGDRFGINVLYIPGIFLATAAITGVAVQLTIEACGRRGRTAWFALVMAVAVVIVFEAAIFGLVVAYMRHCAAYDAAYRKLYG